MENNELAIIPEEVKQIELQLPEEKRNEINKILGQMFVGTSDLQKKVDAIVVKDHTDNMAMQMADAARKNIKRMRLDGVELFNQKRDAVQMAKLQFDTEDKLWLKAKQMYEISLKAIEEVAAYKADTLKRYEQEQKELKVQERLSKIQVFNPETTRFDIENLSDDMFTMLLNGVEKEYNDRIETERKAEEERIERERLLKLLGERQFTLAKFGGFYNSTEEITIHTTEAEFNAIVAECEKAQTKYEVEQERIRVENERLKKEAEEKEKQLELERQQAAKERAIAEEKAQKERELAEAKLKAEQDAARLAAEQAEKEKADLEEKIRLQKEAELKAHKEKEAAELAAKKEAEKLAKAPIKKQLEVWIDSFSIPAIPITDNDIAKDIASKFNDFKNWAKKQTENI